MIRGKSTMIRGKSTMIRGKSTMIRGKSTMIRGKSKEICGIVVILHYSCKSYFYQGKLLLIGQIFIRVNLISVIWRIQVLLSALGD